MGVQTTADEKLAEAKKHVHEAVVALNEIVVLQCWGHDDFAEDHQVSIEQAYHALLDVRRKLGP